MSKPESMSHKEWLIKKMSLEKNISERIITAVINHQFDSARNALKEHNTVEISNFGKFSFNIKKAVKKMKNFLSIRDGYEKMLSSTTDEEKIRKLNVKLNSINSNIEALKPKVDEYITSVGRLEE